MADIVANFFELWGWAYLGPFSQYMYKEIGRAHV